MWITTEDSHLVNLSKSYWIELREKTGLYIHLEDQDSPIPLITVAGLRESELLEEKNKDAEVIILKAPAVITAIMANGQQAITYTDLLKHLCHGTARGSVQKHDNCDSMPIRDLHLSVRAMNALHGADIVTVGQLKIKKVYELLKLKNFGRMSLRECRVALKGLNIDVPW